MSFLQALALGVVEGITEFLPVSSTAHLMFATRLMGIAQTPFVGSFTIAIQLGAIGAVALVALRRVAADPRLAWVALAAFLPSAIFGAVAYPYVKQAIAGSALLPILALGMGGVALVAFEKIQGRSLRHRSELSATTWRQALAVGFAQCAAFVPGVSRAAATVVGGMSSGMSRVAAVELSFLLAVPTLAAATGLDLLEVGVTFSGHEWALLLAGFLASFATALATVRWLLRYVETHTFVHFGLYRVAAALALALVLL